MLYLDNGYLDIEKIISYGMAFNFITGGRGTGKTYGTLKWMVEHGRRFMLLRRTQKIVDLISGSQLMPFKQLNADLDMDIDCYTITKDVYGFYDTENVEGKRIQSGRFYGYMAALSTFANLRGFDGSDIEYLIYDEFIPQREERSIKNEGSAFFNAYETINRNRELAGRPPLRVLALANSNDAANPLFASLELIDLALDMVDRGQEVYLDKNRDLGLFMLSKSPISTQKQNTALYRLTKNTPFYQMATNNQFTENHPSRIGSRPLIEMLPIVSIGEITIYKHKSESYLYVCRHKAGAPTEYHLDDTDKKRFVKIYSWIWAYYITGDIIFRSYHDEVIFLTAFGM